MFVIGLYSPKFQSVDAPSQNCCRYNNNKEQVANTELHLFFRMEGTEQDNVNDHRAAAIDLQAEKAARLAAPCASYCYHARDSSNGLLTLRQLQQRKCQPDHWTYDAPVSYTHLTLPTIYSG